MKEEMKYREFVVRGRVYSGNESHATHTVYWALADSSNEPVLIEQIAIENGVTYENAK